MAGFYVDMAKMVQELLNPDSQGGLGQGPLVFRRATGSSLIDSEKPWLGSVSTYAEQIVKHIGKAKAEYRQGEAVIGTDYQFMVTVPSNPIKNGDEVFSGGTSLGRVVHVEVFPPNGTAVYVNVWVNK